MIRNFFILLLCLSLVLQSCATINQLTDSFDGVFKGNTKRDPEDYSLDEKRQYKKHLQQMKLQKKHEEREILERLVEGRKN